MLYRLAAFIFRFDFGDIIDVAPETLGRPKTKTAKVNGTPPSLRSSLRSATCW
jgi:hypothetical protein